MVWISETEVIITTLTFPQRLVPILEAGGVGHDDSMPFHCRPRRHRSTYHGHDKPGSYAASAFVAPNLDFQRLCCADKGQCYSSTRSENWRKPSKSNTGDLPGTAARHSCPTQLWRHVVEYLPRRATSGESSIPEKVRGILCYFMHTLARHGLSKSII